jgi:hypothetical protein
MPRPPSRNRRPKLRPGHWAGITALALTTALMWYGYYLVTTSGR